MRIFKFALLILSTALPLLGLGCSQQDSGGPKKFLIGTTDANGNYSLQTVTLTTLDSPLEMKGLAAAIPYMKSRLGDEGFQGAIARPHLTLVDDTYVSRDPESSLAVAVYAEMESLYLYDQSLGVDGQLRWPRNVGVELNIIGPGGTVHDNAMYLVNNDAMAVLPYSGGGVPLALNHGVLGHEHFHAHFQSQVTNHLNPYFSQTVAFTWELFYPRLESVESKAKFNPSRNDPNFINSVILRAWNEGLADLNGAICTGDGNFFNASLPLANKARSLSNPVSSLQLGINFKDYISSQGVIEAEKPVSAAYAQGSLLARALFRMAYSGAESPQAFMRQIFKNLIYIPSEMNDTLLKRTLDVEDVVPILLKDVPLNGVGCASLKSLLSPDLMLREFNQCVI